VIRASSRDRPAASRARGSAQCSRTTRSVLVNSPVSGVTGISWRTRSLIRRWCSAPCRLNRSHARTRRSSAAASTPGSSNGCRLPGASSGSRARVSASMPLLLACRDAKAAQVRRLGRGHPEHPVAAGGEEHRDRQPRRPGRLHHDLQPGARRRPGQRRRLQPGQAFHRRAGPPPAHLAAVPAQHPYGVVAGDAQVHPDQASLRCADHVCSSVPSTRLLTSDRPRKRRDDRRSRPHAREAPPGGSR
jgi:hypothetical protein